MADIELAVSEAISNALLHAYVDRPAQCFLIGAERIDDRIELSVRDYGRGLKPRDDSPGAGMGLHIISELAEHSAVTKPDDGRDGTAVTMSFALRDDVAATRSASG